MSKRMLLREHRKLHSCLQPVVHCLLQYLNSISAVITWRTQTAQSEA